MHPRSFAGNIRKANQADTFELTRINLPYDWLRSQTTAARLTHGRLGNYDRLFAERLRLGSILIPPLPFEEVPQGF
jgi:hypothetical protein